MEEKQSTVKSKSTLDCYCAANIAGSNWQWKFCTFANHTDHSALDMFNDK